MDTSLVIMAAGIGSRYKEGIKQLESVGENGEILLEYSVYDAIKAGFNKVIFVIRKEIEEEFHSKIGKKMKKAIKIEYAYQDLNDLPKGYKLTINRKKPWGTGHAVLSARNIINEPFAVINADDYYGIDGFIKIHDFLLNNVDDENLCMAAFILGNTLSDNGAVTRGVCEVNDNNILTKIVETFNIVQTQKGIFASEGDKQISLDKNAYVSMNMWGFPKSFINKLKDSFISFLDDNLNNENSEYLLPYVIEDLIISKKIKVSVLKTDERWFGMTYKDDMPLVRAAIKKMIDNKKYPKNLF